MRQTTHRKRWLWWLAPLAVYLAIMIAFQPLVYWETRRILGLFKGYSVTFRSCWFHPLSLTSHVTGLRIVKESAGGAEEPFLSLDDFGLSVDWREVLRAKLVAKVELDGPSVHLIAANSKSEQQADPEIPDLADKLAAVLPLKVQRINLTRGEVRFVDKTKPEFPRVVLDHLEATVENFATRAALAKGEPTVLAAAGTLQGAAKTSVFATLDPLAKGLFFSGQFRVTNFPLAALRNLLSSESGLQFDRGTLDLFAEFDCHNGELKGGIKPLLKNSHVVQGKPGLGNLLKTVVADAAIELGSDRVPERNAVATVIPIAGRITRPDLQIWPALAGVIRNAFVAGVTESFSSLPPAQRPNNESGFAQVIDALDKGKGPPKAEPTAEKK